MPEIRTHQRISQELCGTPVHIEEGFSRVELLTISSMAVDETGLVHGGFVFGLADYAAMIAVNHPYVVLGAAEVKFLKPVKAGSRLVAEASVVTREGKKQQVQVSVICNEQVVFSGFFTCMILNKHVLSDP